MCSGKVHLKDYESQFLPENDERIPTLETPFGKFSVNNDTFDSPLYKAEGWYN